MKLTETDDAALLSLCVSAANDKHVFDELVRRYGSLVLQTVSWTFRRYSHVIREDVEDVFQEVFSALFKDGCKALRCFDPNKASFGTYLATIAKNTTINSCKMKNRNSVELTDAISGEPNEYEKDLENKDAVSKIKEALLAFSAKDRLFYHLYFKENMPPDEVASLLGITIDTVYSKKAKIVDKLTKSISPIF
jgi:RNA polymerase sigma-70 factor (ECF subfamily)